ncbi:hypothetical protein FIU95_05000 [Microbulbifer sp. THAF38]|nr:hypothetical protein FIU95_05000 [Microbulbifer sp. THAF38]
MYDRNNESIWPNRSSILTYGNARQSVIVGAENRMTFEHQNVLLEIPLDIFLLLF